MKHMSFFLTTDQVRRQQKTVTRRVGWLTAKAGDVVQPVVKGQGLKKGERVETIGGPIEFVDVRREPLNAMQPSDVAREGFGLGHGNYDRAEFIAMFCRHNGCGPTDVITRIEFRYAEPPRLRPRRDHQGRRSRRRVVARRQNG